MNKKKLCAFLFGILLVILLAIGGMFASWKSPSHKAEQPSVHSQEQGKNKKATPKKKTLESSSQKQSVPQASENEKERRDFNKTILEQNYYLEKLDKHGNLTYIKATNDELETLEKKSNTENFNVYQVNYEGQIISVLASSERN